MATATSALLTLDDFARLRDDDHAYELSEGELVQMTFPTAGHSLIAKRIARSLERGGGVAGETFIEADFLLQEQPPILRRPDVAFVAKAHWDGTDLGKWFRGAPLIAVEVVSPSETASDLNRKTRQYLQAGAAAVLVVYPETREIQVHRLGSPIQALTGEDSVELPDLLPDWRATVNELLP